MTFGRPLLERPALEVAPLLLGAVISRAGHLYAYSSYGMHVCANVVCSSEGGDVRGAARGPGDRRGAGGGAEYPWRFWLPGDSSASPQRRHPELAPSTG